MAAPATLKIDIITDAAKAGKGFDQVSGKAGKLSGSLGKLAGVAAGAFSVGAIVSFGKASVTAARESEEATARLDAVFRAMGDSTGKASQAAQDYASALSRQVGVEDEAIMAGQAKLATFAKASDASARAAGTFDRATAAAVDLAATGFGSIESNSVMLGKALQDPAKGLTALGKAGVTFTKAQKDQIDAMVKAGDVAGAHQVILKAVEGQVQGVAAATADAGDKSAIAWGELQETVGTKLQPVLDTLATFFVITLIPAIAELVGWISDNASWLSILAAAVTAATVAITAYNLSVKATAKVTKAWAAVQAVLNGTMALNPVGAVIAVVIALVAIIGVAYAKSDKFRSIVQTVWEWIKKLGAVVWDLAKVYFGALMVQVRIILAVFKTLWGWLQDLWGIVRDLGEAIGTALVGAFDALEPVIDTVSGVFETFVGWIGDAVDAVSDLIGWIGDLIDKIPSIKLPDLNPFSASAPVSANRLGLNTQSSGPSHVQLTVNVNAAAGAQPGQIGDAVVSAVRAYVRRNGLAALTGR